MKLKTRTRPEGGQGIFLFGFEGQKTLSALGEKVNQLSGGAIKNLFQLGFSARLGEAELVLLSKAPWKMAVFIGLGKKEKLDAESLRRAIGAGVRRIKRYSLKSLEVELFEPGLEVLKREDFARAIAEGFWFSCYQYQEYRERGDGFPEQIFLVGETKGLKTVLERSSVLGEEHQYIRKLIDRPGADLGPGEFSRLAKEAGKKLGLKVRVYNEAELKKMGYNGILRVGQGSSRPPRLVVMEYPGSKKKPIALVGKGVTFDSGGISLKRSEKMDRMKYDMAGAGAVLGTVRACARLGLKENVIGVIPLVENMPGAGAQRPGDIVRMANGISVEVISTDAEGRMILADALYHSQKFSPRTIIDLATLTGSASIALGRYAIALLGNNRKLLDALVSAGEASGERCWILPLWEEYQELVKSPVADLRNVGKGREAGTIVGAVFLQRFIQDNLPWAHLDIASCAWSDEEHPYLGKGATGIGLRLLLKYLEEFAC